MKRGPIACRIASYRPFEALALPHLALLGIRDIELAIPAPAALMETRTALERHGLRALIAHGEIDLSRGDIASQIAAQIPAVRQLRASFLFFAPTTRGPFSEAVVDAFRTAGDLAAAAGVTITLETHREYATNGSVAAQSLAAIGHPAVRLNFDTANVCLGGGGADCAAELRACLPFVASLHLKDTTGEPGAPFPTLGRGVIDFPAVFDVLDAAGFAGPCTLELPGAASPLTEAGICARVADSVAYLRAIGRC